MNSVEDQSHEPSLWQMAARTVIRIRWLGLMIAVVLFGFAWQARRDLQFDRRLETMFVEGDPTRSDFEFLKENFQGNEVLLCVFELDSLVGEGWRGTQIAQADSRSVGEDRWNLFSHGPFQAQRNGRAIYGTLDLCETDASPPILDPKNVLARASWSSLADTRIAAIPR